MYIRINGDRNNMIIKIAKIFQSSFFRVCYWDNYKSIWFNVFTN
jgi:hypothetical protein